MRVAEIGSDGICHGENDFLRQLKVRLWCDNRLHG